MPHFLDKSTAPSQEFVIFPQSNAISPMTLKPVFILLFFFTIAVGLAQQKEFPGLFRSTPEAEGISSDAIVGFLEAVEKQPKIQLHSFMLLRHGKIVAEGSWNPYDCTNKHTLYSVTKSFTATAVGLAIAEGAFNLDDKVVSFFPGQLPDTISPQLAALTIRHLLTMSPGYTRDPDLIREGEWIKAALKANFTGTPGKGLFYNNTGPFLLSAIMQRVTGQKLEDYLTPRLFEPLGITDKDWEYNNERINIGGWGLRLSVESMAKFGQLYLQKGMWNGKQLLPAEWVELATSVQNTGVPQWATKPDVNNDWQQGYGFYFWRCRHNAYRADGALGQMIIVMPDQDAVLAITAGTTATQEELNLVWDHLLPAMKKGALPADTAAQERLDAKLSSLALPTFEKKTVTQMAKLVSGMAYTIELNEKGIEEVAFLVSKDRIRFLVKTHAERHEMNFGNGYWLYGDTARPGPYIVQGANLNWPSLYKVAGVYRWKYGNTMEMMLSYLEGTHPQVYQCKFDKDTVEIEVKDPLNPSSSYVLKGKMRG